MKKWRTAKGWTLRRLGQEAGVSAAFLCDIENGRRFPSAETAATFDRVLGAKGDIIASVLTREDVTALRADPALLRVVKDALSNRRSRARLLRADQ